MAITLATKTLKAIDDQIASDGGAMFRQKQGLVFPHMKDAYASGEEGSRSHLGASVIGRKCAREIWYMFRWAKKVVFSPRMLRLFNRGHLEEARFIAMLLAIGVEVFQQDAQGNQYRISDYGGHFGGSGDGVGLNVPDLPVSSPCVLEFKTHGEKSFSKLQKEGLVICKPEHYVQMQIYMRKMGYSYGLYMAVNKNTDEIYAEIITIDTLIADQYLDRAKQIIQIREEPKRLNESPGYFECRFCDMKDICHNGAEVAMNCRTCYHSSADDDGKWRCREPKSGQVVLDKAAQKAGCKHYLKF